jgi:hypothetical protein
MQLNKFTNNIDDPLHTNGFAAAAKRSGGMGASGPQSFNKRLHIERNRSNVNRYHDSMIANGHHRERQQLRSSASPFDRPVEHEPAAPTAMRGTPMRRPGGRLIADVVKPTPRQRFSEPTNRPYNPYQ